MTINQRKIGTILSYVQIILSNTISLLYTPFMLRMLGQSEYGLFGTANSLTSYLSLFSFGIAGSYIRFNALYRAKNDTEGERKLNGIFFSIFSVISVLVLITGTVFVLISDFVFGNSLTDVELKKIKIIILLTTCQFVVTFLFNTIAMSIQAYERYFFIKMCLIVASIVQPVINIVALLLGGKAVAISVINLAVSICTYLIYWIYARKNINLRFTFRGLDKGIIKAVFVFSGFLFINSITDQITKSTDALLLGVFSGTAAVAIYTVGSSFGGYFMSFSTSVSSVFAPQINRIVAEDKNNNDALNNIFLKVGRVQFLILTFILFGYIIFGLQFINLWAGEDYGFPSYLIGLFLLLSYYIPLFQNVGLEIQKAKNLHKARSIVYFLVAIGNVILTTVAVCLMNFYFADNPEILRLYSGVVASFFTLICCVFGNTIFMNIYYHKKVGLNMIKFWKGILKMVPGLIIPVAGGFAIAYFIPVNSYLEFLLDAVIFMVLYFVSAWFLSMNQYEKDLIKKPLFSFVRKFKKIFRGNVR